MAYATHHDRARTLGSIGQSLSNLMADLAQGLTQHRAYRSTLKELSTLSDHELADIGLHRASIGDVARSATLRA